jgi:3D (Asp-Asp-Asp) domain-containing protein
MRLIISRSTRRQLLVVVIAIVAFVLLYETRMFDSTYATWSSMLRESRSPAAGERLNFSATAYCKGSTTASGVPPKTGVAAADPILLPVGSVINVAAGDAKYSGVYTVMDTGPKVQGRMLDLYMWSCHEALRFGRKEVEITVLRLGWNPQASSPGLIQRLFRRREAARQMPQPDAPPAAGIPPEDPAPEPDTGTGVIEGSPATP